MKDYSEFVQFVAEKSGVNKLGLIERDVILHSFLYTLCKNERFKEKYLFKGGSCLIKCYFGYYRFSVDLDFTYADQKAWRGLSRKDLRRKLISEVEWLAKLIERSCDEVGLDFTADVYNREYIEFGSGSRIVTFKPRRGGELYKVQVNLVEKLIFEPKSAHVRTLLCGKELAKEEIAYYEEYLEKYMPVELRVYSLEEILCEKVRAILTRRAQKLRDFYDLYVLERERGLSAMDFASEIAEKVEFMLRYKRYRRAFEKNREGFGASLEDLLRGFDVTMIIEEYDEESLKEFLSRAAKELTSIARRIKLS